jgi:hypothetical protein
MNAGADVTCASMAEDAETTLGGSPVGVGGASVIVGV